MLVVLDIFTDYPTRAIDSAVVGSSRMHLSSFVSMPLLVKVMVPKGALVVVSRVITLAIQTLESVRTRCTICSCFSRRIRLGIGLATPSQQSVVLNSMRPTTFLTFSTLSMTDMCRVSPAPTIATLSNPRVHSSLSGYSSITPKIV